jgi:hypothetical protein
MRKGIIKKNNNKIDAGRTVYTLPPKPRANKSESLNFVIVLSTKNLHTSGNKLCYADMKCA